MEKTVEIHRRIDNLVLYIFEKKLILIYTTMEENNGITNDAIPLIFDFGYFRLKKERRNL